MKSLGRKALILLLSLAITAKQSEGWLIQRKTIPSPSGNAYAFKKHFIRTPVKKLNGKRLLLQRSKLSDSSSDSLRDDSKPPKRRFKWAAMGLAALLLVPLRATASTIAEPVVVATDVTNAAITAASTATSLFPLAAAPPISAALEMQLSFRLLWAALMGAALGKERSFAKHSAGVRTMALVSMGASAFTVCSAYGFVQFAALGMKCDPSRMAANVASGVGFVGAGVITTSAANQKNVVHGLTTAATIWLSAAVGVACGVGLLRVATTAALTTITILRLGRRKPKNRKAPVTVTKITEVVSTAEGLVEVDDDEAEIHDTSDWDEDHAEDQDQEEEGLIPTNKRFGLEEDPDMEAVVMAAWRNATHQDSHTETIEQFSITQRNQTDEARLP